jgi:hypothetical protein
MKTNALVNLITGAVFAASSQMASASYAEEGPAISDYAKGIATQITQACQNPDDLAQCLKGTIEATLDFSRHYSEEYNGHPDLQGFLEGLQRGTADGTLIANCEGRLKGDFSFNSLKEAHQYTVEAVTSCLNATRSVMTELGQENPAFVETFDDQAWQTLRNQILCLKGDDRCLSTTETRPQFIPQ